MKTDKNKKDAVLLRQQAEKQLKRQPSKTSLLSSETDKLKLIHELQVHQVELEMQNEELILTRSNALKAAEKYTDLYDFAPIGYFTLSKDGKIIELNLRGANMLGKERSRFKNSQFGFSLSNDTKLTFSLFLEKVFSGKTKETCEVTISTDGNPPAYIHLTGIAAENKDQCLVTAIDITERKKTEAELLQNFKKISDYKYAMDESTIVTVTDYNGIIKYANKYFCDMSKYNEAELVGQNHRIINSGHHPKEFYKDLWITITNGRVWRGEVKSKAKDATYFWADTTIVPFLNEKGTPFQYMAIRKDITEHKKAELKLNEQYKELAFQNEEKEKQAAELIVANKELATSNTELEKRAGELIIANKELIFQNEEKEKRAAELIIANKELAYQNSEKQKRADELIIANKELAFQNEEKEKRAAESIIVNKELEQFAYVASHDLQEPLRMVASYTQLLERRYKDKLDQDANDFIQYAVDGANRMQKLINDLLDYSRTTSRGKDFTKVDISQVLGQTISNLQQLIIENNALITNEDLPELT